MSTGEDTKLGIILKSGLICEFFNGLFYFIFNKTLIKFCLHYINWIYNVRFLQNQNKKLFLKTIYLKKSLVLNF